MKKNNKKKKRKLVLLSLLLVLAIGYALLAVTLNINGITLFKGQKWKIYWDNVEVNSESVDGTVTISEPKKTSIVVNASFGALGDFYEFTVDAKNDGDFNAEIDVITTNLYKVEAGEEDEEIDQPDYLECNYTYANGKEIRPGDMLRKNGSRKYKIRIGLIEEVDSIEDLPEDIDLKAVITITYKKSNKKTVNLKRGPVISNMMMNMVYKEYEDDIYLTYDNEYEYRLEENFARISEYIDYFKMATPEQYEEVKDNLTLENVISLSTTTPSSEYIEFATGTAIEADDEDAEPVYMWYDKDSQTVYYYSELDEIYMNEDSSFIFYGLEYTDSIDLDKFRTDKVENMSYMFAYCKSVDRLDLSNFDTSSATNMSYMFYDDMN